MLQLIATFYIRYTRQHGSENREKSHYRRSADHRITILLSRTEGQNMTETELTEVIRQDCLLQRSSSSLAISVMTQLRLVLHQMSTVIHDRRCSKH